MESWCRQEALDLLSERAQRATHILILINDMAIDSFVEQHLHASQAILIHCSGSLNTHRAFGAHPLLGFNHQTYELDRYTTMPFIVDHDAPPFSELLPGLPNPSARLDKAQKAKYHALCVLSGILVACCGRN